MESNSIIVTLPPSLFNPSSLAGIRSAFDAFGPIESWTVLTSFGRILIVYNTALEASRARESLDWSPVSRFQQPSSEDANPRTIPRTPPKQKAPSHSAEASGSNDSPLSMKSVSLNQSLKKKAPQHSPTASLDRLLEACLDDESPKHKRTQSASSQSSSPSQAKHMRKLSAEKSKYCIRVFFGPPLALPLQPLSNSYLSVPELTKNFLVSPPGSPPVDWEPQVEEGPNKVTFPNDENWINVLSNALTNLQVKQEGNDHPADRSHTASSSSESVSTHLVIEPQNSNPSLTISIIHEDEPEAASDIDTVNKNLQGVSYTPNPSGITQVRATVESTLGYQRSPGERKIQPTPRPF